MLKEFGYLADINEGIFLDQALVVVIVIIWVVLAGGEGNGGELRGWTWLNWQNFYLTIFVQNIFSDLFESFLLSDFVPHGLRGGGADQSLSVWDLNIEALTEKRWEIICFY